ncbi:DEAD/DEAH box helicase [Sphingobium sp. AN641]|uniref:preprotein translocase subunit SecA n=1 Tax=Sphingobium sp. AN641 TaxID=3133443 RepID=UPI0030BFF1B4
MVEATLSRWAAFNDKLREKARHFWHEARSDARPVIAPYAERGPAPSWKWDRPLDLLLGRFMLAVQRDRAGLLDRAQRIALRSAAFADLSDQALDAACMEMRERLMCDRLGEAAVDEAFALIREVSGRELGLRHFPVQLMAGLVMLDGGLAEMATGEGKTITALLPAITAAMAGMPVHVFTVNDYLAERDCNGLRPVIERFGLRCGLIVNGQENPERRAAYGCDIVYGTNKEMTFDYLRDQTALGKRRGQGRRLIAELFGHGTQPLLMRGLHFAIVDEADSIFIDEARTPLILSAELPGDADGVYLAALELAAMLEEGRDYILTEATRSVHLTAHGKDRVAELSQGLPHTQWRIRLAREELAMRAISATRLFLRDRDYIVTDGKVQIVDESTGRVMADRSWEGGLHQLVETKEAVDISGVRNTMARITYQRFFRRYRRLSGMTGTAGEVADELWADYALKVVVIPRNRPDLRSDRGHAMVRSAQEKWAMVAAEVARMHAQEGARPVLIGTRSVADSDAVSQALTHAGIAHRVLNARQDEEEAEIIAKAGEPGAVTVATNMAGRGTDILLNPTAKAHGGLHVILTGFHDTARIDRQLFGRAGRQGDPGSTIAITALDDQLYRDFAPRAARIVGSSARNWPLFDGKANMLRRLAQRHAEKRHAADRRQTELAEERLRKTMAFGGGD